MRWYTFNLDILLVELRTTIRWILYAMYSIYVGEREMLMIRVNSNWKKVNVLNMHTKRIEIF